MAQDAPNTFAVRRVCLAPRGEGVQPAAKLFGPFDGISPVRSYCLSSLHNCVLTPYCTHGRATIYEFCDQIRHEERRHEGARVLTSQAAHAFSHVETAADTEMYPPTGALRLGRAAIIGFTGNIGHDMYINGGMLDAFATARADDKPFDAIILNVRDRFGDELQRWQDRWQWRVAEALFGVNYTRCTSLDGGGVGAAASRCLLPLRVPSLTCVDELVWKPPHLDFNPMSGTLRHVAAARAAVLGRYAIHRLPGCRTATCAPSVVFYTRGDAARRSLDLSGAALSQGWRERLGVTQILHRMPSAALAQFELFANADVIIAPHGASCGNAFLMRPGAIYIEISTLCPELCLNGCYPYASAGPKCSRRSLLDGAAYAGRGVSERLACEDALSMHGGAVPVYARAAGVYARTVFACVRGNACTDGHIAGSDNGPAAWKRDFHEEIVVDDGLIAKVAAAIAEARAMGATDGTAMPTWMSALPTSSCTVDRGGELSGGGGGSAAATSAALAQSSGTGVRRDETEAGRGHRGGRVRSGRGIVVGGSDGVDHAATWLRRAEGGFCSPTNGAGDCEHGEKGSIALDASEVTSWPHAVNVCRRLLLSCRRARYMTISLAHRDCSWYYACPSPTPSPGEDFVSGRLPPRGSRAYEAAWHQSSRGERYNRCDDGNVACPTYGASSCLCSSGVLRSDSALETCLPTPLCTKAVNNALTTVATPNARVRSALSPVVAVAAAPLQGGAAPSIVLFLVFDKELIRAKYKGKAEAAYEREFKRARQLLLSLRSVGTTLPVHIVVGGDRVPHKESRLTRLGARLLPIKERLKPPPWASEYYRNNFNKLLALNMTQFSTVIVLDNDCVVLRNIDHLAWAVKTPAVTCQPRRGFTLCSHNFGVHVVSPSTADAAALYESYQTRKRRNNGGEQEVWANFHKRAYELPIGYNAHRGMVMSDAEWRDVHIVHMISGYATNRMPDFVRDRMVAFDL